MKKILFVTAFTPTDKTAGQAFSKRLISNLREKHLVTIIAFRNTKEKSDTIFDSLNEYHAFKTSLNSRLRNVFRRPFIHPIFTSRFSNEILDYLNSIKSNYDLIYFDFSQVFLYADYIIHEKKILMAHDVISQMYGRHRGLLGRFNYYYSKLSEFLILKRSRGEIYTFSEKDSVILKKTYKIQSKVVNFYLDARIRDNHECNDRSYFLLYGAWSRRENYIGLKWFLDNVAPKVNEKICIKIMGGGLKDEIINNRKKISCKIEYLGFIENPYPIIKQAKALIAPLFEGAGVKVKVIESLACGTPIIGTSVAFEGIDRIYEYAMIECHNSNDFVKEIENNSFAKNDNLFKHFHETYTTNLMHSVIDTALS